MSIERVETEQETARWAIDFEWLAQNGRLAAAMAWSALCPECRHRITAGPARAGLDEVMGAIRQCCAAKPGYINAELPIMESVFRLFLANGNEPLDVIELGRQLSERRGIDTYRTSVQVLTRLLEHDDTYGLRRAGE